jgi:menaquinone-dependent protoporphyrinogen oxidase
MSASILIGYATRGGSTAEVARAIGVALQEGGLAPEVLPVDRIQSIEPQTSIILGAPLYAGRFPKEFHKFLTTHRTSLAATHCWCFVLGPTRAEPADFDAAKKQAEKQLARYSWFNPVELHIFGGRWDSNHIPFPFSLVRRIPGNPLGRIPAADVRDWSAIRAWAAGIASQFKPAA